MAESWAASSAGDEGGVGSGVVVRERHGIGKLGFGILFNGVLRSSGVNISRWIAFFFPLRFLNYQTDSRDCRFSFIICLTSWVSFTLGLKTVVGLEENVYF